MISIQCNGIIHSSRMLSISLIRCDDQVFNLNGIIKQENIDNQVFNGIVKMEIIEEIDHHNDSQLLQKGTKTEEERNTIDTEVKAEIDFIEGYEGFESTVLNESNFSEFFTHLNLNLTSNCSSKNLSTDNCDETSTASYLTVHTGMYTREKSNKSEICEQGFSHGSHLTTHLKTHTKEKPYKGDCDKLFFGDDDGQNKASTVEVLNTDKNAQNEILLKKFDTSTKLFKNLRSDTSNDDIDYDNKPALQRNKNGSFNCPFCNELFTYRSKCINHLTKHMPKMFKCSICLKNYSRRDTLKRHMEAHKIPKKKIKYNECNMSCTNKQYLVYHKKTKHSKTQVLHKCKVCQKSFVSIKGLKYHLNAHAQQFNFKCEMCDQMFTNPWNKCRHKKKMHK